jgi:D-methionine transport system ATP-binding protein
MIEIVDLSKSFGVGENTVHALKNINIKINDGDIYGIIGMSGAGKSTLVRCINMLERPSEGTVLIDDVDMAKLSKTDLRKKRREITMIFQSFNLLMQRTCLKNVCFPMELEGIDRTTAEQRAMELLTLVGLPEKANAYPAQLSGGQKQRVAIARALATNPRVLLCDEATSALDPNTTNAILELVKDINRKLGITVVVITHQMSVVQEICNRVAILDGGEVVEEGLVGDIFTSPKSSAAKRLVFPGGADDIVSNPTKEKRVRIMFNGAEATGKPLIATMAIECGVCANILSAATRCIDDKIYGSMLLGIENDESKVKSALEFIEKTENVFYEEV